VADNELEPTLIPPKRRPGRPKLRAERMLRYCVSLQPHEHAQLELLGQGSASEGIRVALRYAAAWCAHIATPEDGE